MADIVNLRRARKKAARAVADRKAADNRIRFGTPAALRAIAAAERGRAEGALSAARLERPVASDAGSDPGSDGERISDAPFSQDDDGVGPDRSP